MPCLFRKACRSFEYKPHADPVLFFRTTLFQNTPPPFVATPIPFAVFKIPPCFFNSQPSTASAIKARFLSCRGFKCLVILYIRGGENPPHFSDPPAASSPTQTQHPGSTHHAPRAPGRDGTTYPPPPPAGCPRLTDWTAARLVSYPHAIASPCIIRQSLL
jgi:hypothetical protein